MASKTLCHVANTSPFPYWVARMIGQAQTALGAGHLYPPTKGTESEACHSNCAPCVAAPCPRAAAA